MEDQNYRLTTCLIRFALYFVVIIMPWLFLFEILPFEYSLISISFEVSLYVLWSVVLFFSILQIRKDIKNYTNETNEEYISRRMWKVCFIILFVFMVLTLAYLFLTLLIIGIS